MPLVSDIYSSRWLSGADLVPLGSRRRAVIVAITAEPVGQKQEVELVADLAVPTNGKRWPKRWIVGRTRSAVLAMDYGQDYDQWIGKGVELWAENRMIQGAIKPVITCAAFHTGASQAVPPGNGALPPPDPPASMQMGPNATVPIPQGAPAPVQPGKVWAGPGSELDDAIPL